MKKLHWSSALVIECLLLLFIRCNDAAVARALVKVGDSFNFGPVPGKLIVRRETPAHKDSQYIFAGRCNNGGWTTDGSNKIGSSVHLSWTGELVIDQFSADDAGSYSFPMEEPDIGKPKTLLIVEVQQ